MTGNIFSLAKSHAYFRESMLKGHAIESVLFHSISHAKEDSEQNISHLVNYIDLLMQIQESLIFDRDSDQYSELAALARLLISILQKMEIIRADCAFILEKRTEGGHE